MTEAYSGQSATPHNQSAAMHAGSTIVHDGSKANSPGGA